jgi:uncharacterized membrane protein
VTEDEKTGGTSPVVDSDAADANGEVPVSPPGKKERLSPGTRKAAGAIYRILHQAIVTPQILFLIIATIMGITLVVFNPMFHVADEPAHFWKAYSVGDLDLISDKVGGVQGNQLPVSIQKTYDTMKFHIGEGVKIDEKAVDEAFKIPLDAGKKGFVGNGVAGLYPPVPYIPQAIGIDIGRISHESPLTLAYMGRFFNLLAWLILVFLAISITPVMKWVFFLLGVMPMALLQAASLSPDTVTNGLAFVTIAFFLRLALSKDKRKVTTRDIVLMFVLGILLALVKQPYFLLVLLFFLIPISKFKSRRAYITVFAVLFIVVLIVGLSWTAFENSAFAANPGVSSSKQVKYIVQHPLTSAKILLRSIDTYKEDWIVSFVGAFDWFEASLPIWSIYLFLFALLGAAMLDKDEDITIRPREKLVIAVPLVLIFLGVVLALYLAWTPVGYYLIQGVQGRYLIAMSPLLFLLFYNRAIVYKKGPWFYAAMVAIPVVVSYLTIARLWYRFY